MKNLSKILFKQENLIVLFLLAIASFMRLFRISEYLTFLGDEGRDVLVVKHILEGKLTLLGPTASVGGFFFGPIYYYMMAPFLFLFNYSPIGPAVMIALIGTITVGLIYLFGKEFFGKRAAFIAAILYAIAPVVISYSRSSWNPNPVPFFSLLCAYLIYCANENKNLKLFFIAGILLGIAIQLHFLVLFLGVVLFFYLSISNMFLFDKKERTFEIQNLIKYYILIFIGFLIGWLPYLAFEFRHGFPNTQNIFKFVFNSPDVGGRGNIFATIGNVFFRVFGRLVANFPSPEQLHWYNSLEIFIWQWGMLLLAFFSIGLLIFQVLQSLKTDKLQARKYLLFSFWIFFGILLFSFYKKNIYDYYFGFMFPVPFLLVGNALASWQRNQKSYTNIIAAFILTALISINLYGIPFKSAGNHQLDQVKSIAKFVYDKTDGKPYNFALITGGNSDHGYRYFFELWGRPPVTIEYTGRDPERKTVTSQLLVVCESLPCQPLGNPLWEVAGFGQADIVGQWDVSVVKVYKLVHYKDSKNTSITH